MGNKQGKVKKAIKKYEKSKLKYYIRGIKSSYKVINKILVPSSDEECETLEKAVKLLVDITNEINNDILSIKKIRSTK